MSSLNNSACSLPATYGTDFSAAGGGNIDVLGGTSPGHLPLTPLVGGGKKRRKSKRKSKRKRKKLSKRRTRRTKGKRTRRCKCKTCRCNPCKCTKRSSRRSK